MLGVRGRRLVVGAEGVTPPEGALGVRVMSMDLLLPSDDAPLVWEAPTQAESHTWRGAMEANALREFLADTAWGALDVLLLDCRPAPTGSSPWPRCCPRCPARSSSPSRPTSRTSSCASRSPSPRRRRRRCWDSSRT